MTDLRFDRSERAAAAILAQRSSECLLEARKFRNVTGFGRGAVRFSIISTSSKPPPASVHARRYSRFLRSAAVDSFECRR